MYFHSFTNLHSIYILHDWKQGKAFVCEIYDISSLVMYGPLKSQTLWNDTVGE